MIHTELTEKALIIAKKAHAGQVDKVGKPYIEHPINVAEKMNDELSVCVALLHDVVEDGGVTYDELAEEGFPEPVIEAVKLLTRDKSVSYTDYLERIKNSGNEMAIYVKLADMLHNADSSRYKIIDEEAKERTQKYVEAIIKLCNLSPFHYPNRIYLFTDDAMTVTAMFTFHCLTVSSDISDYAMGFSSEQQLEIRGGELNKFLKAIGVDGNNIEDIFERIKVLMKIREAAPTISDIERIASQNGIRFEKLHMY